MPEGRPPPLGSARPVLTEGSERSAGRGQDALTGEPSSCPASITRRVPEWTSGQKTRDSGGGGGSGGSSSWLCCPDSDELGTVGGGDVARGSGSEMKAAGRQVTVSAAEKEKLNGDMKRRPSYPGELRAKHVNMSTKIWIKVAMAIVYFLCVSVAAFILVIYYVFFWTPDPHYNITSTEAPNLTACAPRSG